MTTQKIDNLITDNLDIWTGAIKKRGSQGRGSSSKIELYGIKKLRELILDLAVRGLLVPQDKNDISGTECLEVINQKKSSLIEKGIVRKWKEYKALDKDEIKFEIPLSWAFSRFGNVLDFSGGSQPPKSNFSEEKLDGYVQLIQIRDLGPNPQPVFVPKEKVSKFCTSNDVMIGRYGASVGKVFWGKDGAYNVALIKVHNDIGAYTQEFLYILMQSSIGQALFAGVSRSAQAGFSKGDIEDKPLPILSHQEQHRIVAKVDELMALCDQLEQQTENSINHHQTLVETLFDALVDSLKTRSHDGAAALTAMDGGNSGIAGANSRQDAWQLIFNNFDVLITTEHAVEKLKQTILQLAVMGKLVPQDPNDEPASVLLEKITAEKEQLIKDGKIKRQKPLPPINEDEKPFGLPVGWEWVRFGHVTVSRLGKMLDKAKNKGTPLPYLRNTNVQWHRIELDDIKLMQIEDDEIDELLLRKGDLLICEGGHPGRCAIWQDDTLQMFFQKALHRARPLGNVSPEHLQYCLTIDAATNNLDKYFTGATIKHFVGAKLNSYVIPLPPAEEQRRIVPKIEDLMALCDRLKIQLNEEQTTQLRLTDELANGA